MRCIIADIIRCTTVWYTNQNVIKPKTPGDRPGVFLSKLSLPLFMGCCSSRGSFSRFFRTCAGLSGSKGLLSQRPALGEVH